MDEAVIKYYRKLLRTQFEHVGSFEKASIFLEPARETYLCVAAGNFMHLYVNVVGNTVDDIRYRCICNPTANVAVEILCTLVKGKTLDEAAGVTEEALCEFLGSWGEDFRKKARGLLELLNRGITQYKAKTLENGH